MMCDMGRGILVRVGLCLLIVVGFINTIHAADEAEREVWSFRTAGDGWSGNGPLKHGVWPVREQAMRLSVAGKPSPYITKSELRLPAEQANVVQIQMDAGSARKCRFWFSTDVSPGENLSKMVEFDLQPNAGLQSYTLDLKDLAAWRSQVTSIRFWFIGAKEGEELSVNCVKVFDGGKISTPMAFVNYRPGQKSVVKEFRAASLFNNNMVLQRDRPAPVWGRGRPGETVTVRFAGRAKTVVANSKGQWSVVLDPMPVCGEPRNLEISSPVAGHALSFTNVVIGDVWLCGGQSNMGGSPHDNVPPVERRKELLETDYPNLRYVAMPSLHRETPLPNDAIEESLSWRSVRADSLRGVSAVSYYFGQAVQTSQKIPIGLLFVIKAGSQIEQWMAPTTLKSLYPDAELAAICGGSHLASGLHNGMIAPILPFPIRGAIWYQGESNADSGPRTMAYYKSLPAFIGNWRRMWGEDLPVMLVQLPRIDGYPTNSWAHIREAQLLASTHLPNVGLAVTFDEGDPKNLHPSNKYFVGTRLGLAARAIAYGEKMEYSGPLYAGMERRGKELELRFTHVGDGLKARGELEGFEICGDEGSWIPAKAAITGKDRLTVSSPAVQSSVAIRYAWCNSPKATLFNSSDLPATPFRSDTPADLMAGDMK